MRVPDLERLGIFLFCNIFRHYEERSDVVISSFHVIPRLTFRLGDGNLPLILSLLCFIYTGGLPSPLTYVRVG